MYPSMWSARFHTPWHEELQRVATELRTAPWHEELQRVAMELRNSQPDYTSPIAGTASPAHPPIRRSGEPLSGPSGRGRAAGAPRCR